MTTVSPLLKWTGGKEQELSIILPIIPEYDRYYEPFLGGGAVFFSLHPPVAYLNDASLELMEWYDMIACRNDQFFITLDSLLSIWEDIGICVKQSTLEYGNNLEHLYAPFALFDERFFALFSHDRDFFHEEFVKNVKRKMQNQSEKSHLECAIKSAFYMTVRRHYNYGMRYDPGMRAALFFFVRELCYSSLFRYNAQGLFNIPFGGRSYMQKNMRVKIERLKHPQTASLFENTFRTALDFEEFFERTQPGENDFIFVDPPYDASFSTYSKNTFDRDDHRRLARLLSRLSSSYLLVIKDTPFVRELYTKKSDVIVESFEKKYRVNIQSRNDRETSHLLIRNYE